jgi:hypothetical protein
MDETLIQRYQVGGDIYSALSAKYGVSVANAGAAAALTGDESVVNQALTTARYGPSLPDSTVTQFANQLINDPLAAPGAIVDKALTNTIATLNNSAENALISTLKNPYFLGAVVVVAFFALGGADYLRRQIAK